MTPARLRWGLLFVLVGVLLLLNNAGYLSWDYWWDIIRLYWPVILIAIGIEMIFHKTRLKIIAYIMPVLLVAFFAYMAVDYAEKDGRYGFSDSFKNRYHESIPFDHDLDFVKATIKHGYHDIIIETDIDDIFSGSFGKLRFEPYFRFSDYNDTGNLYIRKRGFSEHDDTPIWRIGLSDRMPISLELIGRQVKDSLNFEAIPLRELEIDNYAGDIYIRLGTKEEEVNLNLVGRDAFFNIFVPEESGLMLNDNHFMDKLTEFEWTDDTLSITTINFPGAKYKIRIKADSTLAQLKINYY